MEQERLLPSRACAGLVQKSSAVLPSADAPALPSDPVLSREVATGEVAVAEEQNEKTPDAAKVAHAVLVSPHVVHRGALAFDHAQD